MKQVNRPVVVCIGGSDSSGNAGIAMDVRTISALGAHACSVITATTAQNSEQFYASHAVEAEVLKSQLAAMQALDIAAIKIGLIASEVQIPIISEFVRLSKVPVVLDPVLSSSSGTDFQDSAYIQTLREQLIPLCTLITPNIDEAARLTECHVHNLSTQEYAAERLVEIGSQNALVTGGHIDAPLAQDYFYSRTRQFWLAVPRLNVANTRGTGCALASACAAALALEYPLYDALVIAKMAVQQGLRQSYSAGGQQGPIHIDHFPSEQSDLPALSQAPLSQWSNQTFASCLSSPLGLYPVVDRAQWLEQLLPLGVSTIQLRIKDLYGAELEAEIQQAIVISQQYDCRLFINDYWELAIRFGAYGVHLGQEDLDDANVEAIRTAGLRLGISTHCHYEVARAHTYQPSYIAIGPVYSTTTKIMPWVPHGPEGFRYWRNTLDYPLVAIGGINADRIPIVKAAGADAIAMITAITLSENPESTARYFLDLMDD